MAGLPRRSLHALTVLLGWAFFSSSAQACPFCGQQGQTLTGEVAQATMVLYGSPGNRKELDNGEGTTELTVEKVIKDHEWRKGRKTITLPRFVPETGARYKLLIFCDVFKDKIDPYRGIPIKADSDMPKYLAGALALKEDKAVKRLRFFFDYLDNADSEVANDAFKEFANADYRDYRPMAKDLPPDRIAKWLRDPETPSFRFGLYGSLLGHCGKKEHAALLRKLLDDPERRIGSGVDGLLAGYVMLQPRDGWNYIKDILKDSQKEFLLRYAALRTIRFLWTYRSDLVEKQNLAEAAAVLLAQNDIADLAIEDLRKWERWEMADRVLALRASKAYEIPIVRRAMLRFALSCKGNKVCSAYVTEQRKKDAMGVEEVEELLKLDQALASPESTTKKPG